MGRRTEGGLPEFGGHIQEAARIERGKRHRAPSRSRLRRSLRALRHQRKLRDQRGTPRKPSASWRRRPSQLPAGREEIMKLWPCFRRDDLMAESPKCSEGEQAFINKRDWPARDTRSHGQTGCATGAVAVRVPPRTHRRSHRLRQMDVYDLTFGMASCEMSTTPRVRVSRARHLRRWSRRLRITTENMAVVNTFIWKGYGGGEVWIAADR